MSAEVALVWAGPLQYDFGPSHPLQPVRVELAVALMRAYGLLDRPNVKLIPPRQASEDELQLIHTADYIEAIKRAGAMGDPRACVPEYCLGPGDNPIFPRMHEASAEVAGGSIDAAEFVMQGGERHAFSIGGGLHHAMRRNASGFCIYNDASIAIEHLRRKHGVRVLYLDTDAHHGDGVQAAFYDTPEVLTISFHESGRYLFPGTGFVHESGQGAGAGYSVNVPLPPGAGDGSYTYAFDELVPALARAFKPDVIVNQNGADAYQDDPLAHLRTSTGFYRHVARTAHELAHELCEGRWLALGGGGYDLFSAVPRAWTLVFAEMLGADLPDELPASWLELSRSKGARRVPNALIDPPTQSDEREMANVREVVAQVRQEIPLLHG
ncbi:MAG TPA: acetoin utilization protein AcuC [Chloroflexota bacterium]|nr:acetoin utilization protein AcuC [Chloroflexota bacterium]